MMDNSVLFLLCTVLLAGFHPTNSYVWKAPVPEDMKIFFRANQNIVPAVEILLRQKKEITPTFELTQYADGPEISSEVSCTFVLCSVSLGQDSEWAAFWIAIGKTDTPSGVILYLIEAGELVLNPSLEAWNRVIPLEYSKFGLKVPGIMLYPTISQAQGETMHPEEDSSLTKALSEGVDFNNLELVRFCFREKRNESQELQGVVFAFVYKLNLEPANVSNAPAGGEAPAEKLFSEMPDLLYRGATAYFDLTEPSEPEGTSSQIERTPALNQLFSSITQSTSSLTQSFSSGLTRSSFTQRHKRTLFTGSSENPRVQPIRPDVIELLKLVGKRLMSPQKGPEIYVTPVYGCASQRVIERVNEYAGKQEFVKYEDKTLEIPPADEATMYADILSELRLQSVGITTFDMALSTQKCGQIILKQAVPSRHLVLVFELRDVKNPESSSAIRDYKIKEEFNVPERSSPLVMDKPMVVDELRRSNKFFSFVNKLKGNSQEKKSTQDSTKKQNEVDEKCLYFYAVIDNSEEGKYPVIAVGELNKSLSMVFSMTEKFATAKLYWQLPIPGPSIKVYDMLMQPGKDFDNDLQHLVAKKALWKELQSTWVGQHVTLKTTAVLGEQNTPGSSAHAITKLEVDDIISRLDYPVPNRKEEAEITRARKRLAEIKNELNISMIRNSSVDWDNGGGSITVTHSFLIRFTLNNQQFHSVAAAKVGPAPHFRLTMKDDLSGFCTSPKVLLSLTKQASVSLKLGEPYYWSSEPISDLTTKFQTENIESTVRPLLAKINMKTGIAGSDAKIHPIQYGVRFNAGINFETPSEIAVIVFRLSYGTDVPSYFSGGLRPGQGGSTHTDFILDQGLYNSLEDILYVLE